ncbi:MAG: tRNA (adenosine(37)-N6)-threonylcarbamoyltransferase complex ATPase subunit type 1 TsaE [Acidiferrobacterales bacterium]
MTAWTILITDEADMQELGQQLAPIVADLSLVYLGGDLGAGKTTLVRGILRGLDYAGVVKSPTFTLVEPYVLGDLRVYHFDLYRLNDPEELEFLGAREYFASGLCLLEWPEKGEGFLPPPDISVIIQKVKQGRNVRLETKSERGTAPANALMRLFENKKGVQYS